MPKDTFFNLPVEKRETITGVAIDEFAHYSYGHASINRIVNNSGIAKGSFYQYFEDKQDLFFYILQKMTEEKVAYLSPILQNSTELDFFQLVRALYAGGLRFAMRYPQYAAIGSHLLREKSSKIYREMISTNFTSGMDFYRSLLENAIEQGQVRRDVDVQMLAYFITLINNGMVEYYTEYVNDQYDETMLATIDHFVDFLEHGLAA